MKYMIIDGNSIANRAYYGVRTLNAPDGTPTNAIFGFLNIFNRLITELQPDAVSVTFDLKDGTVTVTKDAHPEQDLKKVIPANASDVFAVADMSGMLTVYAVKAGTHTDMNASYTFDEIRTVAFSPDDKYLIILNHSERLDILDAASGEVVFSETVEGVFGDRFDGSDRKIVCRDQI